jgi:hypothetical protein
MIIFWAGGTQIAPPIRVAIDRRDKQRRGDVIRFVVDQVVHNPESRVTIKTLTEFLNIPESAARRIIHNLVNAGLIYEVSSGVWARVMSSPSERRGSRLRRDV